MPADDYALQSCAFRYGFVNVSIPLTDSLAAEYLFGGAEAARNTIVEKSVRIVGNVVMEPGEDGSRLVRGRRERITEHLRQIASRVLTR
jgi:hypothetical protein